MSLKPSLDLRLGAAGPRPPLSLLVPLLIKAEKLRQIPLVEQSCQVQLGSERDERGKVVVVRQDAQLQAWTGVGETRYHGQHGQRIGVFLADHGQNVKRIGEGDGG